MDPNALLEQLIDRACVISEASDEYDIANLADEVRELAEGLLNLHNWIEAQQGFLPRRWDRAERQRDELMKLIEAAYNADAGPAIRKAVQHAHARVVAMKGGA